MKRMGGVMVLYGLAVFILGGCAIPLGEDFITPHNTAKNGIYIVDYNLQSYVPVPVAGEPAVKLVTNREGLDATVIWKDQNDHTLSDLDVFLPNTVYKAEIKFTPQEGYRFNSSISFSYHPGKIQDQKDDLGDPTRTVTVTYLNSDDGNITYVTDYNLENYVPVPVGEEHPVWEIDTEELTGTVSWKQGGNPLGDSAAFQGGEEYTADITLRTRPGYRFNPERFFAYPADTVAVQPNSNKDSAVRNLSTVSYQKAVTKKPVTNFDLGTYITGPEWGKLPNTAGFADIQYSVDEVRWEPVDACFTPGGSYTATAVLTAKDGYTFTGVGSEAFSYPGAEVSFSGSGKHGTVTVVFPKIIAKVTDRDLAGSIAAPKTGSIPSSVFSHSGSQYTGSEVTWYGDGSDEEVTGTFTVDIVYTARVTLTAKDGYTFTGVDSFTYTSDDMLDITTANNTGDQVTVAIRFPALAKISISGPW
ncbi:hypothetical protein LQZ21_11125 [Treponema sp. TIM-1]|uniref:hypothetical protein n=1 Tax=Treponema sp. TIM-1 TaxID=2898417 RepID=UPI003980A2D4